MPFLIPIIVAFVLENILLTLSIVLTIGTTVFGMAQQQSAKKKARRAAAQAQANWEGSLQDRTITRISTASPHRYIYGRARVGSTIVALFTSGTDDQYKYLVCEHAAHECDGVEEVWIDGKALGTLDGDGYVTSGEFYKTETRSITEYFYANSFTLSHTPISAVTIVADGTAINQYLNTTPFSYGPIPFSRSGSSVTITSQNITTNVLWWYSLFFNAALFSYPARPTWFPLDGYIGKVTRYRVTYSYQANTSQVRCKTHLGVAGEAADAGLIAELPSKWTALSKIDGHCYSVVRLDLLNPKFQGGPPAVEILLRGKKLYDLRDTTTAWSQNPALVIYDYLTSDFCNVDVGDLPTSSFITAANVCDESAAFGNLYTCNGTIDASEDPANVLEALADCMAGNIVATTWEINAGKYIAPIMDLEQADIVGTLSVAPSISDADVINGVRGQNVTAENLYVVQDYEPYQNATYLAEDGKDKFADITYPYTDSKQRVHNLARITTEDIRNGFSIKGEFSQKAWDLRVGDRVTFTSAFLGHVDKVFRVTGKSYTITAAVELSLKEDVSTIWDLADTVSIDDTPNTNLVDPFLISTMGDLVCASGTDQLLLQSDGTIVSRILVSWPVVEMTAGVIEVEYRRDTDSVWHRTSIASDEVSVYVYPVEDLSWYIVRARGMNPHIGARGDWAYADLHQVIGKSAPPGDIPTMIIQGRELSWASVHDADMAGYVFRYQYGSNMDWGSAVPLHSGIITSSPFELTTLPFAPVTIMGKAIDTSGNESVTTANIFTDLGDAPIANVVETLSFDPTFPGTLTACTVSGGDLVADSTDSFYGDFEQSFYRLDTDSFYKPSAFVQMVYLTDEYIPASVLAGSIMTLELSTTGADLWIEYRYTGANSFYGLDADSFYTDDADAFYEPPSDWFPWPGQVATQSTGYQFRVTIGSGLVAGTILTMAITIDAPDITESVSDLAIGASATAIPLTKTYSAIKVVSATLQANASGAVTVEIDKTSPLAPTITAYNASHVAVAGSTADIVIQGY